MRWSIKAYSPTVSLHYFTGKRLNSCGLHTRNLATHFNLTSSRQVAFVVGDCNLRCFANYYFDCCYGCCCFGYFGFDCFGFGCYCSGCCADCCCFCSDCFADCCYSCSDCSCFDCYCCFGYLASFCFVPFLFVPFPVAVAVASLLVAYAAHVQFLLVVG